jgi:hypothetical protein
MRITRSAAALTATALTAVTLAACGASAASTAAQPHPSTSSSVQWIPAATLPTVPQVAAEMGATGAVGNCGGGTAVGVIDSGSAYLGKERIGINVFASDTVRNTWETGIAANVGAVIVAQGQNWVAYKALNQTGTGCS